MKRSLFSVSYAGLWGQTQLGLPAFIERAASSGYEAVMLMGKRPHLSPLDVTDAQIEKIQETLQSSGVECAAIGGYIDLAGTGAAEVPYLEMQISYCESIARLASQLGGSVIRIFTAYESEAFPISTLWNRTVTGLREICDRAGAHGITVAVQNHHDVGVHTEALLELLYDIDRPNCKVGFDAWSPALRGENLYECAKKMAPHTVMTTNADYLRLPRFQYQPQFVNYLPVEPDLIRAVKFGEGFIDYPAFFQGLKDGGFDGIVNYEMCSPIRGGGDMENLDSYASHFVEWFRQHTTS